MICTCMGHRPGLSKLKFENETFDIRTYQKYIYQNKKPKQH